MNAGTAAFEARLHTMLENIRTATANTRRAMEAAGDENWVEDGESDAEYLQSIQRDTIARLEATARDIEALLAHSLDG
jgi:RNA polymerase-binding transcription factor DksA